MKAHPSRIPRRGPLRNVKALRGKRKRRDKKAAPRERRPLHGCHVLHYRVHLQIRPSCAQCRINQGSCPKMARSPAAQTRVTLRGAGHGEILTRGSGYYEKQGAAREAIANTKKAAASVREEMPDIASKILEPRPPPAHWAWRAQTRATASESLGSSSTNQAPASRRPAAPRVRMCSRT